MNTRILDRRSYDITTLNVFEVLSSYYVDIYYNHLYLEAKKAKASGTVSSITEGYKMTLDAFLSGMNKQKLYKKAVQGFYAKFLSVGITSISFSSCISQIVKELIPTDYFDSVDNHQQSQILHISLNNVIKNFTNKIVTEHMSSIIDNHKEIDNVRVLQDDMIDLFLLERERMYQKFMLVQTGQVGDGAQLSMYKKLLKNMQTEIKKLIKEKYELKTKLNAINVDSAKLSQYEDIVTKLKSHITRTKLITDASILQYKTKIQQLIKHNSSNLNPQPSEPNYNEDNDSDDEEVVYDELTRSPNKKKVTFIESTYINNEHEETGTSDHTEETGTSDHTEETGTSDHTEETGTSDHTEETGTSDHTEETIINKKYNDYDNKLTGPNKGVTEKLENLDDYNDTTKEVNISQPDMINIDDLDNDNTYRSIFEEYAPDE
jgi:hypothetical protein